MTKLVKPWVTLLAAGALLTACTPSDAPDAAPEPARATPAEKPPPVSNFSGIQEGVALLQPTQGHEATGTVRIRPHAEGIELEVSVSGLPAQTRHGFHIHEYGDCSAPDARSAGPHYDPTGMMAGQHRHGMKPLGDLDDLVADDAGRVQITFVAPNLSLVDERPILGRGLLLHESYEDPDDPLSASGDPIACGTIGARQPDGPRS